MHAYILFGQSKEFFPYGDFCSSMYKVLLARISWQRVYYSFTQLELLVFTDIRM